MNAVESTEQGTKKIKIITEATHGFFQNHKISLTNKQVGVEVTPDKVAMVAALKNTFGAAYQE